MEHQHIWDKTLNPSEQVKYEFTIGKRYRNLGVITFVILGLLCFAFSTPIAILVIAGGAFYFGYYLKAANAFAFSDRRVLAHRGWLSTKMVTTEYQKITDVTVAENFLEKLITGTGAIAINTAGGRGQEIVLEHVERPYEIKKKLDELRGHH